MTSAAQEFFFLPHTEQCVNMADTAVYTTEADYGGEHNMWLPLVKNHEAIAVTQWSPIDLSAHVSETVKLFKPVTFTEKHFNPLMENSLLLF